MFDPGVCPDTGQHQPPGANSGQQFPIHGNNQVRQHRWRSESLGRLHLGKKWQVFLDDEQSFQGIQPDGFADQRAYRFAIQPVRHAIR